MSILGKVKEMLGIVAVKIKIETSPTFMVEDKAIQGKIILTAKHDEQLRIIEVKFEEFYSAGRGSAKSSTKMTLGGTIFDGRYILGGQPLVLDFSFPFTYGKSKNEKRIDKGGLMKTIGKVGRFINNEKSKFRIVVTVVVNRNGTDITEELVVKRVQS
jgi:hypothetical protein